MKPYTNIVNYHQKKRDDEVNLMPSQTIPDQSKTIKEIMLLHTRGLGFSGVKVPVYEGEEMDMPDVRKMDLVEIAEFREQVQKEIQEIRDNYRQEVERTRAQQTAEHEEFQRDFQQFRAYKAAQRQQANEKPDTKPA